MFVRVPGARCQATGARCPVPGSQWSKVKVTVVAALTLTLTSCVQLRVVQAAVRPERASDKFLYRCRSAVNVNVNIDTKRRDPDTLTSLRRRSSVNNNNALIWTIITH